ncbi:MAG: PulJ/GspJ family protein [Neptuniibacter sp.]
MQQRGFTLIELIIVITMLGIISMVTVGFISSSMQGYADLKRRAQLSASVRVAVERMAREVRNALPNSIRLTGSGTCMEFIPSVAASRYLSVPTASAASSFESVAYAIEPSFVSGRVAVYPIDSNVSDEVHTENPVYKLDSHSIISPQIAAGTTLAPVPTPASGAVTVSFTGGSTHRFPTDSPSSRYFIVDEPVSFCLDGTDLYRFQGENGSAYSFAITQPSVAALNTLTEPNKALLASDIVSPTGSQPFRYSEASLQRNSIVLFDLFVQDQNLSVSDTTQEDIRVQFEVQVRNVP